MEQVESIRYSWKWVTASELLSKVACELCCFMLTATTDFGTVNLYDGENTTGELIAIIECLANRSQMFCPKYPIYCRRGLYIERVANVFGAFVQWRELGHKGGGS